MAEIAMCSNRKCDMRVSCYRYRAKPHKWGQEYGDFFPTKDGCNGYWDASEYVLKNLRPMEEIESIWWGMENDI